jgi:hypothetical protein
VTYYQIISQQAQTLLDIAMQEYGDAEGIWLLLSDNPELNNDLTFSLTIGQQLNIRTGEDPAFPVPAYPAFAFVRNDKAYNIIFVNSNLTPDQVKAVIQSVSGDTVYADLLDAQKPSLLQHYTALELNTDLTDAQKIAILIILSNTILSYLTTAQLDYIITMMGAEQIHLINDTQLSMLTSTQLDYIVSILTSEQVQLLSSAQVGELSAVEITEIIAASIQYLTNGQLLNLTTAQLNYIATLLTAAQVVLLNATQISYLTNAQLSLLTGGQQTYVVGNYNMNLGSLTLQATSFTIF